ncbi:MAG: tetratricopeptide repeat protein [Planctomycetota bacterium]
MSVHRILLTLILVCMPGVSLFAADADTDYKSLLDDFTNKRYAEALEKAEKFVAAYPEFKHTGAAYYMGGNAGLNAHEYDRAERLYRDMLEKHADNRHAAKARNELATVLNSARKLEACIQLCEANLKGDPESSYAERWKFLIAQSRYRLWQFEDAEKDLKDFSKMYPESSYINSIKFYLDRINPELKLDANGIVEGYDGKYVEDVRFQKALKDLPGFVKEAWKVLQQTLGVQLKGAQVVFEFRDKGFNRDNNRAITETICVDYKPYTRMVFYTEHIVVSEPDFRSRVIHELKHAAFRDVMGQGYLNLPSWVREGLAVYGAQQFDDRLPAIVGGATFSGKEPRSLLDGIDDPDHDTNDYLEDAAAFYWLESVKKGAVHEYCKRLIAGEDFEKLFSELSGKPIREALDAAADFAHELVNERMGDAEKDFLKLRTADYKKPRGELGVKWLKDTGIPQYEAWLKANPDHPLAPNCRYRLGKALIFTGRFEDGRTSMKQVIELDQLRSSICDDAQYWIAQSYLREGENESAEREFGILLRDYSWSGYVKDLKDKYAVAGPVTEEGAGK